jgi:hypothetical protein
VGVAAVTGSSTSSWPAASWSGPKTPATAATAALSPDGTALLERIQTAGQELRHRLLRRIGLESTRALEKGMSALAAAMENATTGRAPRSHPLPQKCHVHVRG